MDYPKPMVQLSGMQYQFRAYGLGSRDSRITSSSSSRAEHNETHPLKVVQFLYRVDLQSWPAGDEESSGLRLRGFGDVEFRV